MIMNKLSLLSVGAGLAFAALPVSFNWSPANVQSLSLLSLETAEARVGQPLTPGSVAGVHRRAERRAYRRGNYGTGAAVAAGVAATGAALAAPVAATIPASAPSFVSNAVVAPPGYSATVIDPDTGRQCTISIRGDRWCWTP
jgi:hypothetical protein